MSIEIKSIALSNYKGIKDFTANFFQRTKISGRNALGKTTISDAFFDVLTGKLADGTSTDSIMPHDTDGNRIDHVDAYRKVTLEIGGTPHDIEKITKQKWVKPRGETEEHFEGTETVYTIDGFDKKKKDFDEWITANIANQDTLLLCSNAQPFLNILKKSTAEARKLLEKLSGFSTEKVVDSDPQFARVAEVTRGHAVEDVVKQLKRNLAQQKKTLEEKQSNLVYENGREVKVVDVSALEAELKLKEAELQKIVEEEASWQSRIQAVEDKSADLATLTAKKAKLVDEERRIISAGAEALKAIEREIDNVNAGIDKEKSNTEYAKSKISQLEMYIKQCQADLDGMKAEYSAEAAKTYTGSTICPTCNQPLPESMVETAKAKFEESKKKNLKNIIDRGNVSKGQKDGYTKDIESYNAKIAESNAKIAELTAKAEELKAKMTATDNAPDDSQLEDIKKEIIWVNQKIENIRKFLDSMSELSDKKAEWARQKSQYASDTADIKARIAHADDDAKQKASLIAMLTEAIAAEAQKCADIEADIALIENFSLAKNAMLAEEVNRHFQHFQFVFTERTIDGNINETLKLVVNGTPYQNLNGGDRKLAEIDLVKGLQEMNGLCMPIFSDEANTIDPWRIPKTEQQLIVITRSDTSVIDVEELVG